MKGFELVHYPNGTVSLRDPKTGEAMHSSIGPWEEATRIYARQSRIGERMRETGRPGSQIPV